MRKRQNKQTFLAQNFLKSPKLVRRLVAKSTINSSDIVYEIGAGKGIITAELAHVAEKVVAIEKDPRLVLGLREKFVAHGNIEIIERDFLRYKIIERNYKIFANIPYSITAEIMRKILYERPLPSEAYFILQREAAKKFSGCPRETQFSVLVKPLFEFQILAGLRRTDFDPVPNVDSVLLLIRRRKVPLIKKEDIALYRGFVYHGFGGWKARLRSAYKNVFTYKQWKRMSRELSFPLDATPTELSFEQWLGLFNRYKLLFMRKEYS
jgi:23S rRNA (adenine-N6)-dimethyltransferase